MMYYKHLDVKYDKKKLFDEFKSHCLTPFELKDYNSKYYNHVKTWQHCYPEMNKEGTEVKRLVDYFNNISGKKIISHVQFYHLDANASLPLHRDPMRKARCSINILLDNDPAPIIIEGEKVFYKSALIDVSRALHGVKPWHTDRHLVKFTISKYSFKDISNVL